MARGNDRDPGNSPDRPNCRNPEACFAKGQGHCRSCHFAAVATKIHADPAVRAKMSEARKRALADPAVRAKMSAGVRSARQRRYAWVRDELREEFEFLFSKLGRSEAEEIIRQRLGLDRSAPGQQAPARTVPAVFPSGDTHSWCAQCEQRRTPEQAAVCESRFCKLKQLADA